MQIDKEWMMISVMGLSGTLFAWGGTGFKPARRFILPCFLAFAAVLSHVLWWKVLIMALGLCFAFHLGYGERTSYPMKLLTACLFTVPMLAIGFSLWVVITPLLFMMMFWMSNNETTADLFPWKVGEFLIGVFIGIAFITVL